MTLEDPVMILNREAPSKKENEEPGGQRPQLASVVLLLCFGILMNAAYASAQQVIAVPSYSDPGDATWNREESQFQKVKILIINLNNGDDTTFHPYVLAAVQKAQRDGITVLSYTYTRYGKRDPQVVIRKIKAAARNYSIDGVFFDEAPTGCKASTPWHKTTHQYYKALTDLVHRWGIAGRAQSRHSAPNRLLDGHRRQVAGC